MALESLQREMKLIREHDLLPKGGTVLCAVSGGADSVYLLDRLYTLRCREFFDFTLVAAHYNHRLRGEESDRDEAFVRELLAKRYGAMRVAGREGEYTLPPVELIAGGGDVAAEAKRRRKGVEETAREMRYAFLREAAEAAGAGVIATAHTADDNLETLLLHLARGAGLQGLAGIQPRQGKLARPLLATTRREIEEYLRLYGIAHVEDSSNADEAYSRNRMRRQVLPLLEGFNPALRENSIDTIRYLRADNDYLNARAAELSAQAQTAGGDVSVSAALLAQAPEALAVRAVRQLLALLPGGSTDYASAHLEAVVRLCRGEDPSAQAHLPGGITARREYALLRLTAQPDPVPLELIPVAGREAPIPGTEWTLRLDREPWPGLVVRSRQSGDGLTLPGRPGRSLKKLFIDAKIPRWERERVPVLADGDGVIAVAGFGLNTAHPRYGRQEVSFSKREKEKG